MNEITTTTHLGEREAIQQIRDRIVSMMPGATDAPPDVVWAAAQLAVAHQLNPFNGEIYIMPIGNKKINGQWVKDFRPHVGVKGLRRKAREQSDFMTEFRDMAADEVKRHRRDNYHENDIGVECTLYRLDVAQKCAHIGIPYKPTIAVGFWRQNAKFNHKNNEWLPDNTPNTWADHQVAKKRAEINAIKEAFDMTFSVADPATVGDDQAITVLNRRVLEMKRDEAPIQEKIIEREDDGDILFLSEDDGEFREADQASKEKPEHTTPLAEDGLYEKMLNFLRAQDAASDRPMSNVVAEGKKVSQYGLLCWKLDDLLADIGPKMHGAVLSAICERKVSAQSPPGAKLQTIIDWLLKPAENAARVDFLRQVAERVADLPENLEELKPV